jgi:hypothetical protein
MTTSGVVPVVFLNAETPAYEFGRFLVYTPRYEPVAAGR